MAKKYEGHTIDELTKLAKERNVENASHYRKAELKRLLRAMDNGDEGIIRSLQMHAQERAEKQRANAERVQKSADDSAERTTEKANEDVDAKKAVQDAVAETRAAKEVTERAYVDGADGDEVVRRMLARAGKLSAHTMVEAPRRETAAERAMRLAGVQPGPPGANEAPRYEVLEDVTYHTSRGTFRLHKGAVVSAATHDIAALEAQDVQMRPVRGVEVRFNEMGVPEQRVVVDADVPVSEDAEGESEGEQQAAEG